MIYLARCLGLKTASFDALLTYIVDLRHNIGIPNDLNAIGINADRKQEVAAMAILDPSASGNPLPLTGKDYLELFTDAVNGDL